MGTQVVVSTSFDLLAEEFNQHDAQAGQSFVAMLNAQEAAKIEYQAVTGKIHGFNDLWAEATGLSKGSVEAYNWLAKKTIEARSHKDSLCLTSRQLKAIAKSKKEPAVSDLLSAIFGETKNSLYLITNEAFDGWVKIGESDNPKARIKDFQTASPFKYELVAVYEMPFGFSDKKLHAILSGLTRSGEWFYCDIEKLKATIAKLIDIHNNIRIEHDDNDIEQKL